MPPRKSIVHSRASVVSLNAGSGTRLFPAARRGTLLSAWSVRQRTRGSSRTDFGGECSSEQTLAPPAVMLTHEEFLLERDRTGDFMSSPSRAAARNRLLG